MSILKKSTIIALLISCSVLAFPQNKPRLGILPFTGGSGGDGETIATLFSLQPEILNAFTVVPRTSAANAIIAEQNFQMSGYTNSDTIARIGRMLNADYVVSGHIRQLGNRNLVIATIVNVETFEQMAGDYHTYQRIEEVRNLLPTISKNMISASKRNSARLPKLAVAPFNIANKGVNQHDAETLGHILAVEIANTGKYAVLPRTTTMQSALRELEYQRSGYTAEEGAKALGRATNAEYVLYADVRSLGSLNMFTAQILHVEDGRLFAGGTREYQIIDDGINLMEDLSILLTDQEIAASRIAALSRERSRSEMFSNKARFWSIGVSAGTSFAAPWIISTLHGTIAPLKYQFLELGIDYGMVSGNKNADFYYSLYPFIHYAAFIPFNKSGGCYAGAGAGYMFGNYKFPEEEIPIRIFAFDAIAGVNIINKIDISYSLRTNFKSFNHKASVGYTYRFK